MASLGDLFVTVGAKIDGFKTAMADVSSTVTQTANTASTAASKINGVFSTVLGAGLTATAIAAANKFDQAFAQIQRATGATEEKMKGLEASFANVYKQTAASSEAVASTLALLSTRTQATGKDLEDLTLKTLKLAKTQNEDVAQIVPLVTRAFGDWSIAANQQGAAMDYLRIASQRTGTQVSRLAEQVVYAGAPLRQLGYGFDQAVALIGKFEKEGVNTELVLGGMKAALQKFVKEGVTDTAVAWQQFIKGVKDGSITFKEVAEEVGAKRAVDLFKAIQEGRFEIDGMVKSFKELEANGGQSIETLKTKVTKWTHEVETLVAAHKDLVLTLGLAIPALTNIGTIVGGVARSVATMGPALAGILSNPLVLGAMTLGAGAAIGLSQLGAQTANLHSLDAVFSKWITDQVSGAKTAEDLAKAQEHVNQSFAEGLLTKAETAKALDLIQQMQNKLAAASMNAYLGNLGIKVDTSALKNTQIGGGTSSSRFTVEESVRFDLLRQAAERAKKAMTEFFAGTANVPVIFADQMDKAAQSTSYIADILNGAVAQGLKDLPDAFSATADAVLNQFDPAVLDAANEILRLERNAQAVTDAFHYFNLKTPEELRKSVDESRDEYEILRNSGEASAAALNTAFTRYKLAQIELDHQLGVTDDELYAQQKKNAEDTLNQIDGKVKDTTSHVRERVWSASDDMKRAMGSAFDSTYRALSDSLIHWKDWGRNLKSVVDNLASDMLSTFLKAFFKPIEDAAVKLAGKLGSVLGGIFGGGGSAAGGAVSAAGGAASSAGGSAGAAASSGLMGAIGVAGSVVSAISGVIGNFQMHGIGKDTGKIEVTTRGILAEVQNLRADDWTRESHWYGRTSDMWRTLLDIKDLIGRGAGGAATFEFNNCTFGAGTSQSSVDAMMQTAYRRARAALG